MRPPLALRARFVPLPEKITAEALVARFPEKKQKKVKVFTKYRPDDDVGDTSQAANPLGSHIYFYNHLLSKRVIYSLYQTLYNNKAMKQVTFMGKKTVPEAIRKDMWTPFLTASFTNPKTGLKAFQHLRELRKLHETQWDMELMKKPVKERSKILQDQRATSIADLAAVCKRDVLSGEKVRLRWMNIYDAEYADEWPVSVVHDVETAQGIRYHARRMGRFVAEEEPVVPAVEEIKEVQEVGIAEAKPEEVKEKITVV
ncbi:hypothetical protein H072_3538 [Dactylellina haptotyla CBS 200.50]|uniref:Large ribosomal subunit protein mL67 n=1 Tax=Dactylellina haptotyla (strain CBS 200.50) TaxID=1284197 RepID=S8BSN8_DACHA|nr:hypothetical protein H072_3538 [Dactylellina haptotyla CBS 200.50]